ncbi:MAG TPA: glycosyltransferase family 2 protein, partial [Flavobacteriales bacterium]|nr:glycosyltransferase family 2 protein [Flavobacteriales bacterium]
MSASKRVSVVIPCRNEEKYIAKCIESVLASNYPSDMLDVFVCDGMSTDSTREIVKNFHENNRVTLLDNLQITTPFALNLGIEKSLADIIIILGAHAELDKDYVKLCVETFEIDPEIGCVGGILDTISLDENSAAIALAMSSVFGVGNAHFRTGLKAGYVDTVAFGAYRKEVFERVGLFDSALTRNQDDEFNFRLIQGGFRIYLNPNIRAKYYVRSTFSKLYKQYKQYGYWKVYVNRKFKVVTTLRQLAPPLWVLFLIALPFAWLIHPILGTIHLILLLLYVLMSLLMSLRISRHVKEFGL